MRRATTCILIVLAAALTAAAPAAAAQWLAGDGHVHTCYSHDSWCPPDDDNTGPDTFYSAFATVGQRFAEARAKRLDFLVISDHDDVRAWKDPAFGSQEVVGVRAYEASLPGGHAQVIGATRHYEEGPGGTPEAAAESLEALRDDLRADGGSLQANHPGYRADSAVTDCDDLGLDRWSQTPMHWRYGFSVRPALVEVWNATSLIEPAELYWECWLQRGTRVAAGAGSDSHGANHLNIGLPTMWVLARDRTEAGILEALRRGRTTLTRRPPSEGPLRLELEGPRGEVVGDRIRPGDTVTARLVGAGAGWLRVRANGETIVEGRPLAAGQTVTFTAPRRRGWLRASLLMRATSFRETDPACKPGPLSARSPIDTCVDDVVVGAITSPMYVGRRDPSVTGLTDEPVRRR